MYKKITTTFSTSCTTKCLTTVKVENLPESRIAQAENYTCTLKQESEVSMYKLNLHFQKTKLAVDVE